MVVAIDGPAASGKSTVARTLAPKIGAQYINTGSMYRAATWLVLRHHIDPRDDAAVATLIAHADIRCDLASGTLQFEHIDPEPHLREPVINDNVSTVASIPAVRERLVTEQRRLALGHTVVMEGRDIGSIVFPDTPYKYYIDATPEVRRQRRTAQGHIDNPGARDQLDLTRAHSPLTISADAEVIDSSHLSIDAVVERIVASLASKGFPAAS